MWMDSVREWTHVDPWPVGDIGVRPQRSKTEGNHRGHIILPCYNENVGIILYGHRYSRGGRGCMIQMIAWILSY